MSTIPKRDRVSLRIDSENKALLEKAASLNHLSVTSYILSVVMKQAEIDIKNNEIMMLNIDDSDLIMKLLEEGTEPNENLIRLIQ